MKSLFDYRQQSIDELMLLGLVKLVKMGGFHPKTCQDSEDLHLVPEELFLMSNSGALLHRFQHSLGLLATGAEGLGQIYGDLWLVEL